jgi:hypothetical protein
MINLPFRSTLKSCTSEKRGPTPAARDRKGRQGGRRYGRIHNLSTALSGCLTMVNSLTQRAMSSAGTVGAAVIFKEHLFELCRGVARI